MTALVTGASGGLGRVLCAQLVSSGWRVWGVCRREAGAAALREAGVSPILADLEQVNSLPAALPKRDDPVWRELVVIHAAARVELRGPWELFARGTIDTTKNLLDAVLGARPLRVVHVSTAGVYSPRDSGTVVCADSTPADPPRWNYYARAKLTGEQLLRHACDHSRVPWCILRPAFLYGAHGAGAADAWARGFRRGLVRILGSGNNRIAVLHVSDAAEAIRLASVSPTAAGRTYDVAADDVVTQKEWLAAQARAMGFAPPTRHANYWTTRCVATLAQSLMLRLRPRARHWRTMVELLAADQRLNCGAIRRELGWRAERSFADWAAQVTAPGVD